MERRRLRDERMQRGWSQEELAEKIGISRQGTISAWERGVQHPHPRHAQKLAKTFGYRNPNELLG